MVDVHRTLLKKGYEFSPVYFIECKENINAIQQQVPRNIIKARLN